MSSANELRAGRLEWSAVDAVPVAPGILARSLGGRHLSVSVFELEPGAVVPLHAHANEEFGYVVAGELRLRCDDGREETLGAGDTFFVPGDGHHEAIALDPGCRLLECYAPPRLPAPSQETPQ